MVSARRPVVTPGPPSGTREVYRRHMRGPSGCRYREVRWRGACRRCPLIVRGHPAGGGERGLAATCPAGQPHRRAPRPAPSGVSFYLIAPYVAIEAIRRAGHWDQGRDQRHRPSADSGHRRLRTPLGIAKWCIGARLGSLAALAVAVFAGLAANTPAGRRMARRYGRAGHRRLNGGGRTPRLGRHVLRLRASQRRSADWPSEPVSRALTGARGPTTKISQGANRRS